MTNYNVTIMNVENIIISTTFFSHKNNISHTLMQEMNTDTTYQIGTEVPLKFHGYIMKNYTNTSRIVFKI